MVAKCVSMDLEDLTEIHEKII